MAWRNEPGPASAVLETIPAKAGAAAARQATSPKHVKTSIPANPPEIVDRDFICPPLCPSLLTIALPVPGLGIFIGEQILIKTVLFMQQMFSATCSDSNCAPRFRTGVEPELKM
jgi:hypothetical protein